MEKDLSAQGKFVPSLGKGWMREIGQEFEKSYFNELRTFLLQEVRAGKTIYPKADDIFRAFKETEFDDVKVVMIGQDPYHGPDQAHGMCFSVGPGIRPPPSLVNIYKEIENDLGLKMPAHGYLATWAAQGVLLLNTVLTVEKGLAGSHRGKGWEVFTDRVIEVLNQKKEGLVFLLWGSPAQKKAQVVDAHRHYVLKGPHPSPLSAYRGFFGGHHFSLTNKYLTAHAQTPIDWSLPLNVQ